MDIHTNIPLKNFTTMRLGGNARFMGEAFTRDDVVQIYKAAKQQNVPVFILGSGSNVIVGDAGYSGIVVRMRIAGFEVVTNDANGTTIKIGAGENWDEIVERTVDMHLSGIEAMSAIPGTAGAAPVQNVGAYGQEIADTLVSLEAYDTTTDQFVELANADCGFSYRHSIFRGDAKGRYVITSITLRLSKNPPMPPFYDALQRYFDEHETPLFTPQTIREAVTAIRKDKLPDPAERPNAGSFFKNAIVDEWLLTELKKEYPEAPSYSLGNKTYKVPTGWLIEQTGKKGELINGMRVHDKNCLVLINESATSYNDLANARDEIIGAVRDQFRIQIEQEPLEI